MYQEARGDGLISSSDPHWHSDSITVADILYAAKNILEAASMVADDIDGVCVHSYLVQVHINFWQAEHCNTSA